MSDQPLPPYRVADLMKMFGYRDVDSFRAWRARAEAQGFPPPIVGCTRPLKWSRELVDAWRACGGRPAQHAIVQQLPEPAPVDELAAGRARLALKAQARAAGALQRK